MKLTNVAAVSLLFAGAGLVGCQDKPAVSDGAGDRMYPSDNNTPTGGRSGMSSAPGSNADGPAAAVRDDLYGRGNNSTNANGQQNTAGGSMAPYNGAGSSAQPGASLGRTGTSSDTGGSVPTGTPGR